MDTAHRIAPLHGIRILDFTNLPPGAACTVMLADLGAEVIRIEPPAAKGKPSLVVGQVAMSRAKKSLTLDMRNPDAAAILLRMMPAVDVVIENARPGAMEQRGFGYAQAQQANPGVIWCAITGFGQTGPNADHAGHDLSFLAHSGLLAALGGDEPWHPGQGLALPAAGMAAVIAIQGALLQRHSSGQGAFLDISLSESALWFLTCGINPLSDAPLVLPASPDRRLYACADGRYVAVACAEPRTWAALCDGLGLDGIKGELHKRETADASTRLIADVLKTKSAAEWVARLAPMGAAVTMVNRGSDVARDAHVVARGGVSDVAGTPVPSSPIHIDCGDAGKLETDTRPPPVVGADTAALLAEFGFSDAECAEYSTRGLI